LWYPLFPSRKFRDNSGSFSHKVKYKLKSTLCLTERHAMKTYRGNTGIAPRILILSNRWMWVVSFTPRPLYLRGNSPGTCLIAGQVGSRAYMDALVKRKIPVIAFEGNWTPVVQTVAYFLYWLNHSYTSLLITMPYLIWRYKP